MMTFVWSATLQWYTPVLMGLLHLVVRCITELGSALEDPFGNDITDLPMDKFCKAIEMQVAAVFNDTFQVYPSNEHTGVWPVTKLSIDKVAYDKALELEQGNADHKLDLTESMRSVEEV